MRTVTDWIGTLSAFSRVSVTMSALAVMPGRSLLVSLVMAIFTSNSVFCAVEPAGGTVALLAISETLPVIFSPSTASTSISAFWPILIELMSFSSTLTSASMAPSCATFMITSSWNCEPIAISPRSLFRSLTVPEIGE